MILKSLGGLWLLCILAASADEGSQTSKQEPKTAVANEKDTIDASSTIHRPSATLSKPDYMSTGRLSTTPVEGRIFPSAHANGSPVEKLSIYRTRVGREYVDREFLPIGMGVISDLPKSANRVGYAQVRSVDQAAHLTYLPRTHGGNTNQKPAVSLRSGTSKEYGSGEDCDKSSEQSRSTEEGYSSQPRLAAHQTGGEISIHQKAKLRSAQSGDYPRDHNIRTHGNYQGGYTRDNGVQQRDNPQSGYARGHELQERGNSQRSYQRNRGVQEPVNTQGGYSHDQRSPHHVIRDDSSSYSNDEHYDNRNAHPATSMEEDPETDTQSRSRTKSYGTFSTSKSTSMSHTRDPNPVKPRTHAIVHPSTVKERYPNHLERAPEHEYQHGASYEAELTPNQGFPVFPGATNVEDLRGAQVKAPLEQRPTAQYSLEHSPQVRQRQKQFHSTPSHGRGNHEQTETYDVAGNAPPEAPIAYEYEHKNLDKSQYDPATGQQGYRNQYHKNQKPVGQQNAELDHRFSSHGESVGSEESDEYKKAHYHKYRGPNPETPYPEEQPARFKQVNQQRDIRNNDYETPQKQFPRDHGQHSLPQRDEKQNKGIYYENNSEHLIQPSRSGKAAPQDNYERFTVQDAQKQEQERPHYRGHQKALRPQAQENVRPANEEYQYESHPDKMGLKNEQSETKYDTQPRHSPKVQASMHYAQQTEISEPRFHFPGFGGEEPRVIIDREAGKPYISHSVSYSQSSYNMDDKEAGEPKTASFFEEDKLEYEPNQKRRPLDASTASDDGTPQQISYKPYNSEYPASYANDQHHNQHHSYEKPEHQSYERPEIQSYDAPEPQSYNRPEPQSYNRPEQQSYDGPGTEPQSYERPQSFDGSYADQPPAYHGEQGYQSNHDDDVSSGPLHLDENFFDEYKISKKAKIIVATAVEPNLYVADGTKIGQSGNSGSEEQDDQNYEGKTSNHDADAYSSPKHNIGLKEAPGSFTDLVNTDARFLRKLSPSRPSGSGYAPSFHGDSAEYRNGNKDDDKSLIVSHGKREIIQQHGDGVSRIVFNVPKERTLASATKKVDRYSPKNTRPEAEGGKMQYAKSERVEKLVKPNQENNKDVAVEKQI